MLHQCDVDVELNRLGKLDDSHWQMSRLTQSFHKSVCRVKFFEGRTTSAERAGRLHCHGETAICELDSCMGKLEAVEILVGIK